jgi:hypothetical protein
MSRSTKSLFSVLAAIAATAVFATPGFGEGYVSPDSVIASSESSKSGDTEGYVSPDSIMANSADAGGVTASGAEPPSKQDLYGPTTTSITDAGTPDPAPEPVVQANDGFDWGDAAVGGAISLGLAAMAAFALSLTRQRRPGIQPSA